MAAWTKMDGTMSRCYVISLSGKLEEGTWASQNDGSCGGASVVLLSSR